jgi:DNA-binding NarL/FixJ family response regulator
MKTIRIVVADDHTLVRAGFRSLLKDLEGVEVVAEAANGREALRMVQEHHPDVVLMDIMMPELNGLDATARLTATSPKVRVIILSMSATEEYVLQAVRAGAAGYLLKDVAPPELELAVRTVARGETFLTAAVSKYVIAGYLQKFAGQTETLQTLTPRQREVLQLIAEGNTTKQIAKKLSVSVKTAEGHRTQLMEALDIHDVAGLVRYAIRMGVITSDR